MTEHMSADKRAKMFREHYASGGREMPKANGRGAERKGEHSMWSKEAGRDATHSKD